MPCLDSIALDVRHCLCRIAMYYGDLPLCRCWSAISCCRRLLATLLTSLLGCGGHVTLLLLLMVMRMVMRIKLNTDC